MRESVLQANIVRKLRNKGWLIYKWVSPGRRGVPDLICFAPGGQCVAIEVKTPTGRVSKFQARCIEQLTAQGVPSFVVRSIDEVEQICEDLKRKSAGSRDAPVQP